jgi:hypothetical protein
MPCYSREPAQRAGRPDSRSFLTIRPVQHNHDTRGDTRRGCVNAPGRGVIVGCSCSLALRTILHRDAAQWTLLHFTMYFGCLDAAGLLLDAGADPSIKNNVRRMRWQGACVWAAGLLRCACLRALSLNQYTFL